MATISDNLLPDKSANSFGVLDKVVAFRSQRLRAQEALRSRHDASELLLKERTAELEKQVSERYKAEECLRELTARVLHLQDDERRHIARELHDSAGQYLVALQMNLTTLQRGTSVLTASQASLVADSMEIVNRCMSEIRTLSYLMHPPLLDEMGLAVALKGYSVGFAERSGIRVDLDIPGDLGRLPSDSETALFRVVQQSLANIHRHSGSHIAKIKIRRDAEHTTVEIGDAGRGIAPELLRQFDDCTRLVGVGIAGMRERIRGMRGQFSIRSAREGTTIEVSLPILEGADRRSKQRQDRSLPIANDLHSSLQRGL